MERMIDAETEELSKREKYRERRGEEYDVVSKVAFLIGVPDSHWKSQYTGLDSDIYEQLSDNRDARIIRNLCGLRTEIERNFKRFSMLILMELKNLHTIPQTQGMVNQLRKDEIDIIKANPKLEEYLPKSMLSCSSTSMPVNLCFQSGSIGSLCGSFSLSLAAIAQRNPRKCSSTIWKISNAIRIACSLTGGGAKTKREIFSIMTKSS